MRFQIYCWNFPVHIIINDDLHFFFAPGRFSSFMKLVLMKFLWLLHSIILYPRQRPSTPGCVFTSICISQCCAVTDIFSSLPPRKFYSGEELILLSFIKQAHLMNNTHTHNIKWNNDIFKTEMEEK